MTNESFTWLLNRSLIFYNLKNYFKNEPTECNNKCLIHYLAMERIHTEIFQYICENSLLKVLFTVKQAGKVVARNYRYFEDNFQMDFRIHENFFEHQVAVGEILGFSIKNDDKFHKILKSLIRIFVLACMLFPFICGVHFYCSNLRDIVNITETLAPCLNILMCLIRCIMFVNNGDLIKKLINDLKSETRQGEFWRFDWKTS